MRLQTKTLLCVAFNGLGFSFLAGFVLFNADLPTLFRVGPSDDLYVLSSKIDSWNKYVGLLCAIGVFRLVEVLVNDVGSPGIAFNLYNPSTRHVYGFTYGSLTLAANIQWVVNALSGVFKTLVIVSRFDIAIFSVLVSELVSGIVVHHLASGKKFHPDFDTKEEAEAAALDALETGIPLGSIRPDERLA